jgi:two-component sensor histidine kinase
MSFKPFAFSLLIVFALFFILPAQIQAIPITDIRDLNSSKELKGPWVYAPAIVTSINDSRLNEHLSVLPKFFESTLGNSQGAITFALRLKTTPNQPLSIHMKQPFSVWKLYANDVLIGASGILSLTNTTHKASPFYPIISFTPNTETTTLMLFVGNSQHHHIGFYGVPLIAPKGVLEQERLKAIYIQLVVAGILVFFALYHIGLFLAWRKDKAPLWFGLLGLALALRSTVTGEKTILQFLPNISWEMMFRLEYASGYIALPFFVMYVGSLYPKQTSKVAEHTYLSIGLLFFSFALFTSPLFFTSTLEYYEMVVVTFIVYTIWILFQSFKSKESGSSLALGAFLVFAGTVIHDLLMFEDIIISSTDLLPYGFILYIMAQAAILLLRYADAFRVIESYTNNLENLIAQRTVELRNLVSQRELLLRELTHRVKNNLQLILGLLWIQLKEANEQTNVHLKTFESQVKAISSVHEALCTQSNIGAIEMNNYIHTIVSSLKHLYPTLNIHVDDTTPIFIKLDDAVSLGLIINELFTNHLKHSDSILSTQIVLKSEQIDKKVIFTYYDGSDHRASYENAQETKFGLPKLGWSMIKNFVIHMDAKITLYPDSLEISFFISEQL